MVSWFVLAGGSLAHRAEGTVQITVKYDRCTALDVEEDDRVCERNKPRSDEALRGLAFLGIVVDNEGLPAMLAIRLGVIIGRIEDIPEQPQASHLPTSHREQFEGQERQTRRGP